MSAISNSGFSTIFQSPLLVGPADTIYSYLDWKDGFQTAKTCTQAKQVFQRFKKGYRKEAEKKLSEEDQKLFRSYDIALFDIIALSRFKSLRIIKTPLLMADGFENVYKKMKELNVNIVRAYMEGIWILQHMLAARVETEKPSGECLVVFNHRFTRILKVQGSTVSGVCCSDSNPIFLKSLMEGLPCYSEGFGITENQTLVKGKPNIRLVKCKPESKKTDKTDKG